MRISVLGLGRMGTPIARNLLEIGHEVTLYNRTRERALDLAAKGARIASSVADAAREAQVALTMVSDDAAVEALAYGPEGLLTHLHSGAIHLCMSSIGYETSQKLAAAHERAGQGYVAAPVFGRPGAASSRHLWIVAGGPEPHVIRCLPIFDALARGVTRVGPRAELAHAVKLGGNVLTVAMVEGLAEVLAYGEKAGMPPADYLRLLNTAIFKSPLLDALGGLMVRRSYDATDLTLDLATRDLKSAVQVAKGLDVAMPLGHSLLERLESAGFKGWGELDLTVLSRMCRIQAGLEDSLPESQAAVQKPPEANREELPVPEAPRPKKPVPPVRETAKAGTPRAARVAAPEPPPPVAPPSPAAAAPPEPSPEATPEGPEATRTSLSEILMAFVPDFVRPFVTGKEEATEPSAEEAGPVPAAPPAEDPAVAPPEAAPETVAAPVAVIEPVAVAEPVVTAPAAKEPVADEPTTEEPVTEEPAVTATPVAETVPPEVPEAPAPDRSHPVVEVQAKVLASEAPAKDIPKPFAVDLTGSFFVGTAGPAGLPGTLKVPATVLPSPAPAAEPPAPATRQVERPGNDPAGLEPARLEQDLKAPAEPVKPLPPEPSAPPSPKHGVPSVHETGGSEAAREAPPAPERVPLASRARLVVSERPESHTEEGFSYTFKVKSGEGSVTMDLHKTSHFEIVEDAVWAWVEGKRYSTAWRSLTEVESVFRHILFVKIQRHILLQPESVRKIRPLFGGRAKVSVGDGIELDVSRAAASRLKEILGM